MTGRLQEFVYVAHTVIVDLIVMFLMKYVSGPQNTFFFTIYSLLQIFNVLLRHLLQAETNLFIHEIEK